MKTRKKKKKPTSVRENFQYEHMERKTAQRKLWELKEAGPHFHKHSAI